jgi:hypothetical protein
MLNNCDFKHTLDFQEIYSDGIWSDLGGIVAGVALLGAEIGTAFNLECK